jgi:hypothetical protein
MTRIGQKWHTFGQIRGKVEKPDGRFGDGAFRKWVSGNSSSCWMCHPPNQALSDTFEKAKSSLGLGTLNWLHLSQNGTKLGDLG